MEPGSALPSERELTLELGISRVTVRCAMVEMVRDGFVVQRHGSIFVSGPPERVVQSLSRLYSFSEDMMSRGRGAGTLWLGRGLIVASAEEALRLEHRAAPV